MRPLAEGVPCPPPQTQKIMDTIFPAVLGRVPIFFVRTSETTAGSVSRKFRVPPSLAKNQDTIFPTILGCVPIFFRTPSQTATGVCFGYPFEGGGRGARSCRCSLDCFVLVSSITPFMLRVCPMLQEET